MIKDFVKSGIIYSIPTIVSRALSIVLVPLYTRVLSPADYGVLDLLSAFGNLALLTVALEISQAVARFVASEHDPSERSRVATTGLWFTVLMYSLFVSGAQILAPLLSGLLLGEDGFTHIFRLSVLQIALNGVTLIAHDQLRWQLRPGQHVVGSVLTLVFGSGGSVFFTLVLDLGVIGMILGLISGSVVTLVYSLYQLRDTFTLHPSVSRLRKMLSFSIPLVPSGMAVFISRFVDRLIIRHFLELEDVGLYGIAFRLAGTVSLLTTGFRMAMSPLVYARHDQPETPGYLAVLFRYFLAFFVVVFAFLSLFSSDILRIMTTEQYWPAAKLVPILVPAILLSSMYIFAPGPFVTNHTKRVMFINIAGAVFSASINWILVPRFGYSGAAVGTLLGYGLIFTSYMFVNQSLYPVPHDWRRIIPSLTIIVGVVVVGMQPWFPFGDRIVTRALLVGLVLVLTVALRLVTPEEVNRLRELVSNRIKRS